MTYNIKRNLSVLLCICVLSAGLYASARDTENQREADSAIRYFDGTYAEVAGTAEYSKLDTEGDTADSKGTDKDVGNRVIGSKTYVYHGLDGKILFSYTVKASFLLKEGKTHTEACCTTFYVSDGWEKQRDIFGDSSGTAVFSNGKTKKRVKLTISCSPAGMIS